MAQVAELRRLPRPLRVQLRLRVGAGDVRLAAAPLPAEVDLPVAPASGATGRVLLVARVVALERGPGLQQRAVHGEVVGGEQPAPPRLGHHLREEGAGDVVLEQAVAVLGEAGGVERLVADVEVEEPLEEQVVAQPLAELALAADRVERDQQARLEQVLGRDRRPAALGVHRVEQRREPREHTLHERLDAADRVIVGDEGVRRDRQQHVGLTLSVASHGAPPGCAPASAILAAGRAPGDHLASPFSAPC